MRLYPQGVEELKNEIMHIKEVIVVEGKDDRIKITQAVNADTIVTNGSAIDDEVLQQIKHAQKKRGVIIFTDPDYPGERIRRIIEQEVPGCKHAFLTPKEAKSNHPNKKSIGIEHASIPAIRNALKGVYNLTLPYESSISRTDLLNFRLIGSKEAKSRREKLGKILQIGQPNGKQLLKRLKMFHITKEAFTQAMEEIVREENKNE